MGGDGPSIDDHPIATIAKISEWERAGVAYVADSCDLTQTGGETASQIAGFVVVHPDLIGVDDEVHHMVRLEAKIHGLHGGEAAHEVGSDNQQYKRTGNLQCDQAIAHPMTAGGHATATLVQDSVHIRPCNMQSGRNAHDNASQQSDGEGIGEDAPVEFEQESDGKIRVQVEVAESAAGKHA